MTEYSYRPIGQDKDYELASVLPSRDGKVLQGTCDSLPAQVLIFDLEGSKSCAFLSCVSDCEEATFEEDFVSQILRDKDDHDFGDHEAES